MKKINKSSEQIPKHLRFFSRKGTRSLRLNKVSTCTCYNINPPRLNELQS